MWMQPLGVRSLVKSLGVVYVGDSSGSGAQGAGDCEVGGLLGVGGGEYCS